MIAPKLRDLDVNVRCYACSNVLTVNVNTQDFKDWESGEKHAQDAFPYLTAADRELLISHTCGECWDKTFGETINEQET